MVRVQYVNLVRDRVEKLQVGVSIRVRSGGSDNTSVIFLYFLAVFFFSFSLKPPIVIRSSHTKISDVSMSCVFESGTCSVEQILLIFYALYSAKKLNEPWYKRKPQL